MAIDGTYFPSRDHAQKWSTFQENWVDTRAPMYWPILSPGQQHPGYWLCRISFPCLPRGKVSSARVYSPLENGRKRRYTKTKQKGSLNQERLSVYGMLWDNLDHEHSNHLLLGDVAVIANEYFSALFEELIGYSLWYRTQVNYAIGSHWW